MVKQIEDIEVDRLHFDPQNPRLPKSTIDTGDEEQVINWMLRDASIIELMGSIGEKGFFPAEPLLVVEIDDRPNHYSVVEGNRRLSAVKLLLNPDLATKRSKSVQQIVEAARCKPTTLPAFIYLQRTNILDYLGFKHITGVKAWSALAKAKYLRDLRKDYVDLPLEDQYRSLAKAIGSRSDYVQQLLVGLELFKCISENDYFDIPGLNEETLDFGVYYNSLRWKNIRNFLEVDATVAEPVKEINVSHLEMLVKWVSEKGPENRTRLGESRNLGKLDKVLGAPKAIAAFNSGSTLDESIVYTEEPDQIFKESVYESLSQIGTANKYIHLISNHTEVEVNQLKEIRVIASNLRLILVARESEDEDD